MSYILDALKKSEAERLSRDAPGFADVPQQRPIARAPRWIWLVGALLFVNAIVVTAFLLQSREPSSVGSRDELPAAAAPPPASTAGAAPPVLAAPQPTPDIAGAATDSGERPGSADPVEPARQAPAARPPAPVEPAPAPRTEVARTTRPVRTAVPRTFMELRADGTLALPDLHLDIHVFSSRPDERFVFVNMSKYREGDALAEGPRVVEIDAEGVILEYRDTVFLLPRE